MKKISIKKGLILSLTLVMSIMMGFSQNDDSRKAAKEAAVQLTATMTETLSLTPEQKELASGFNEAYAISIFTTTPLTDDAIKVFDATLDTNLKDVLNNEQYLLWGENKVAWLKSIKDKVIRETPKEEIPQDDVPNY